MIRSRSLDSLAICDTVWSVWPALVSVAALLVFPLTMAYVIVVHRAMDVRVVLRQGLQYLLATSGIRILQIAISAGVREYSWKMPEASSRLSVLAAI